MTQRRYAASHDPASENRSWGDLTPPDTPFDRMVRYVAFGTVALALHFTIAWLLTPGVFSGGLTEPDGYMRLVRVQRLWETGAWFDGTIPRSNAPFGETLHWTRPFDVWLLLGAAPLSLLMPFPQALHAWAVVSTPVLLVATCVLAVWAIHPVVRSSTRYMVMIALLVQPAVMSYALPGRADHHVLVFLVFVLFVGTLFRAVATDRSVRWERSAGLALAFATWLTVESLVFWVGALLALAALWVVRGSDLADRARALMTALTVGLAFAVFVDGGAQDFTVLAYDRVSLVHLVVALVGIAAWAAVGLMSRRTPLGKTAPGRALLVLSIGALSGMILALALPDFFRGPWADLTPEEQEYWVNVITELQPVVPTPARLGVFMAYMGPALICVPFALWRLAKEGDRSIQAAWTVVVALLVLYVPLGMSSLRFTPFPQILFAVIITALLAEARPWFATRSPRLMASVGRAALALGLFGGFLLLGGLLSPAPATSVAEPSAPCLVSRLAADLPSEEAKLIVAHQDFGQEILYYTPHHVLGTVYHRNIEAVRLTHRVLTTGDEAESHRLLQTRGADFILICPDQKGGYFGRESSEGGPTLYARLVEGPVPTWLEHRPLEGEGTEGFLLFAVDP